MITVVTPNDFIHTPEKVQAVKKKLKLSEALELFFHHLMPEQDFPQGVSISHMEAILGFQLTPLLPAMHEVLCEAGWLSYVDMFNNHLIVQVHPLYNPDDEYWD